MVLPGVAAVADGGERRPWSGGGHRTRPMRDTRRERRPTMDDGREGDGEGVR